MKCDLCQAGLNNTSPSKRVYNPRRPHFMASLSLSWSEMLSRMVWRWCAVVQLGASWKGVFTAEAKWESGRAASSLWSSTQPHKLHQPIQMPCLWHPDQKRKHIIWNKFTRLLLVAESPIFWIINNWVISQNKQRLNPTEHILANF